MLKSSTPITCTRIHDRVPLAPRNTIFVCMYAVKEAKIVYNYLKTIALDTIGDAFTAPRTIVTVKMQHKYYFWRIVCVSLHTYYGPGRRECSDVSADLCVTPNSCAPDFGQWASLLKSRNFQLSHLCWVPVSKTKLLDVTHCPETMAKRPELISYLLITVSGESFKSP